MVHFFWADGALCAEDDEASNFKPLRYILIQNRFARQKAFMIKARKPLTKLPGITKEEIRRFFGESERPGLISLF